MKDARWRVAMRSEYDAQIKHRTWDLVPHDPSYNLVAQSGFFASNNFLMGI